MLAHISEYENIHLMYINILKFNKNNMNPVDNNPNNVILNEYSLMEGIKSETITKRTVKISTISGKKY